MLARALALVVLVAVIAHPGSAGGTIVIKKNLETLVKEADLVVVGRVIASEAAWFEDTGLIFTHTTLLVEDGLKGKVGKTVVISEPGGRVGDVTAMIHGMPQYAIGERVLVPLRRMPLGIWRTHGLTQGKFPVVFNRATEETVVPKRVGLEYVTRKELARVDKNSSGAVEFDDFKAVVRQLVAKTAKKEAK